MKTRSMILIVFILTGLLMTACQAANDPVQNPPVGPTATMSFEPTRASQIADTFPGHEGEVTGLEVYILESFPVQVHAQVSGYFSDGCVELVDISAERDGNTYTLILNTQRPSGDVECTQALVPFEEVVPLDVNGLPAGTYTVIAGDMQSEFVLDMDNEIPEEPVISPEPGIGLVSFQAVDRDTGVGFSFQIPEDFMQEGSEEDRTWLLEGPEVEGEGVHPTLSITLYEMDEESFEAWIDGQRDQLNLPQGNFDDQITLYQGIALDVEDWEEQAGVRVQWIPVGEYVLQLVFSPLDAENYPLAAETVEALYELVMGSWKVLGE